MTWFIMVKAFWHKLTPDTIVFNKLLHKHIYQQYTFIIIACQDIQYQDTLQTNKVKKVINKYQNNIN